MGKQLTFDLPEIDRVKTKEAVEAALEKYRFYLLAIPDEKLPKVTSTYSIVPPSNTNAFHSITEDIAIYNVDREREVYCYLEWVIRGVNRLSKMEREIIYKRYLEDEETFDYEIYNELVLSERRYFHVLRESNMPALLTENGFIDNANDAAKLKSSTFIENLARGHVNGIVKSFNLPKKNSAVYHTVVSGDTVYSLSRIYEALFSKLKIGTTLMIITPFM